MNHNNYDIANEGIFSNKMIASVGTFHNIGMSDREAEKAMYEFISFLISRGMVKKSTATYANVLYEKDLNVFPESRAFITHFLSKWYKHAGPDVNARSFMKDLEDQYLTTLSQTVKRKAEMRRNAKAAETTYWNDDFDIDDAVLESIFAKKSLDEMLSAYLKGLDKKLKTVEDCDELLAKVKVDAAKFNDNLQILQIAKSKYDKNQITLEEFKQTTKKASREISSCCKTFKLKLSDFGGDGINAKTTITKEDIMNFKSYLSGVIKGINALKNARKRANKTDSATESSYIGSAFENYKQEFNQAITDLETLY